MLSKPEEISLKGLVPRTRFVEMGMSDVVFVFGFLVPFLVPVWFLTSYTVDLSLVQTRERKKKEKKRINFE